MSLPSKQQTCSLVWVCHEFSPWLQPMPDFKVQSKSWIPPSATQVCWLPLIWIASESLKVSCKCHQQNIATTNLMISSIMTNSVLFWFKTGFTLWSKWSPGASLGTLYPVWILSYIRLSNHWAKYAFSGFDKHNDVESSLMAKSAS